MRLKTNIEVVCFLCCRSAKSEKNPLRLAIPGIVKLNQLMNTFVNERHELLFLKKQK